MGMELSIELAYRRNIAAATVEGGMHENLPQGTLVSDTYQEGAG